MFRIYLLINVNSKLDYANSKELRKIRKKDKNILYRECEYKSKTLDQIKIQEFYSRLIKTCLSKNDKWLSASYLLYSPQLGFVVI